MVTTKSLHKINFDIREFDSLDSTNSTLKRILLNSPEATKEGTVVIAEEQKSGYGRTGTVWESPIGNLYLSVLLTPNKNIRKITELSYLMMVAIGNTLKKVVSDDAQIQYKWPNDILLNNKKLGGIILETSSSNQSNVVDWVIIGVGLNISSFPEKLYDSKIQATSLQNEDSKLMSVKAISSIILDEVKILYEKWMDEGNAKEIILEWLGKAYYLNKNITIQVNDGTKHTGKFTGVNATGELLLTLSSGKIRPISITEISNFLHSNSDK